MYQLILVYYFPSHKKGCLTLDCIDALGIPLPAAFPPMLALPPGPAAPILVLGFAFPPLAPKLVRPLKLVRPGALPLIERRRSPSDELGRVGIITCAVIFARKVECDALVGFQASRAQALLENAEVMRYHVICNISQPHSDE
jgi:hypothetical protein